MTRPRKELISCRMIVNHYIMIIGLIFLQLYVGVVVAATPAKIAYLTQNRYDLQNSFISNLLKQLEREENDFSYELISYESDDQIVSCIEDGSCLASLDYEY